MQLPAITPATIYHWTQWLWFLLCAAWLGFMPLTKRSVYGEPVARRARYGLILALGLYLLFAPVTRWSGATRLDQSLFRVTLPVACIGFLFALWGIGFSIWARFALDGNWSAGAMLKQGHTLTRSGPYRVTRHPIYTGFLLGLAGSAVERGTLRGAVALVLCWGALTLKLHMEERLMLQRFGDAYVQYRREVPALFPLRFHG
jgi:protein-S-isoprenylcysteine O-methyltransferase Ste14